MNDGCLVPGLGTWIGGVIMKFEQLPLFTTSYSGKAVGKNRKWAAWHVVSEGYRKFREDIAMCTTGGRDFGGKVRMDITFTVSNGRDVDSLFEPVFDGIEMSGVIRNDNQIMRGSFEKVVKKRGTDDLISVTGWAI